MGAVPFEVNGDRIILGTSLIGGFGGFAKLDNMENLSSFLEPGQRVQHPDQPDWGIGQVQSNINNHITVNFPEMGKVVINTNKVNLILIT